MQPADSHQSPMPVSSSMASKTDDREDEEQADSQSIKVRTGSVKVFSDIRTAFRAFRRSAHNCGQTPDGFWLWPHYLITDYSQNQVRIIPTLSR
jgi:hypothetical protein